MECLSGFPPSIQNNGGNVFTCNTIFFSQNRLSAFASGVPSSNFSDTRIRDFYVVIGFARTSIDYCPSMLSACRQSVLGFCISDIVFLSSCKKVFGIYASTIIAFVANIKSLWNLAVDHLIGKDMRPLNFPVKPAMPITSGIDCGLPSPTSIGIGLINSRPKVFNGVKDFLNASHRISEFCSSHRNAMTGKIFERFSLNATDSFIRISGQHCFLAASAMTVFVRNCLFHTGNYITKPLSRQSGVEL